MGIVLKIIAIGGPVVLALMGIYVTDRSPKQRRWAWVGGFLLVALISVVGGVEQSQELDARFDQMTGGNNFGFLAADSTENMHDAKAPLVLINNCNGPVPLLRTWISKLSGHGDKNSEDYWAIDTPHTFHDINPHSSIGIGRQLGVGSYYVDLDTRLNHYVEYLTITEINGYPHNEIRIFQDDVSEPVYVEGDLGTKAPITVKIPNVSTP